jgi:hypothetical protein
VNGELLGVDDLRVDTKKTWLLKRIRLFAQIVNRSKLNIQHELGGEGGRGETFMIV